MKHYCLYFFLFVLSGIYAQNKGSLSLNISIEEGDNYYQNRSIDFLLIKADSIYARDRYCMLDDHTWKIDSIDKGTYQLKIIYNDSLLLSFHQVNVAAEKLSHYNFNINSFQSRWRKPTVKSDSIHDDWVKGEFTINTLYGNNSYDQPTYKHQNEMVSGDMAFNVFSIPTKYYAIGLKIGGQYSRTEFYNDTTRVNGEPILSRHYSYFDINAGIINRFTFFNNRIDNKDGLKLDMGLIYHLPLFFRQVEKINYDTRKTTKHIHTYTDFTVMARLGYKYIGVQAEYSLFNFLKKNYIETPQLRVGIVFYVPLAVN